MSDSSRAQRDGADRSSERSPAPQVGPGTETPPLRLAIVEYDGRPDRGTIHPRGSTGIERMETWLSVDVTAVVDLSAWR